MVPVPLVKLRVRLEVMTSIILCYPFLDLPAHVTSTAALLLPPTLTVSMALPVILKAHEFLTAQRKTNKTSSC